jgi:hypothetical protein
LFQRDGKFSWDGALQKCWWRLSRGSGEAVPSKDEPAGYGLRIGFDTGLPFTPDLPEEPLGMPWMGKPTPREQLTETVARLNRANARPVIYIEQDEAGLVGSGSPQCLRTCP